MRVQRLIVFMLSMLLLIGGAGPARAATSRPAGAVKLPASKLKVVGKVRCGRIGGVWLPGTSLKGGYFITHVRQSANYRRAARKARGAKKRRLSALAKAYARKASTQRAACSRKPAATPVTRPPIPTTPARVPKPLLFNLAGAAALAVPDSGLGPSAPIGVNLKVIGADGLTRDAAVSGAARVAHVLITFDNRVFLTFRSPVSLADTQTGSINGCVLAQVDPGTGVPTCVDSSLQSVQWPAGSTDGNPPLKLDDAGGVYYLGTRPDGATVLRRMTGTTATDLVSGSIAYADFVVLPDRSVVATGMTMPGDARWVRRVTAAGAISTLRSTNSQFLRLFPDNNVYMGLWGPDDFGVRRYLTAADQVEDKYWIADVGNEYFSASTFCGPGKDGTSAFCGSYGARIVGSFRTSDDSVYVVAGYSAEGQLMQYYPTVRVVPTALSSASMAVTVGRSLVVAGLNDADENVLVLHDTATDAEAELLSPDNEIEISHLAVVPSTGKVLFEGLQFADGATVLGSVDPASKEVKILGATPALTDLQAFR